MSNVASLFGGPVGQREPNETCIETLEEWLEMARAGEIVGVAMAGLSFDGTARYGVGGRVGGYGIVGALEIAKTDIVELLRDED